MSRTEEHMDKVLQKIKEAWLDMPDQSFMWMLCEHLPEEDTFWTTDEQLLMLLDGLDPWEEEESDERELVELEPPLTADEFLKQITSRLDGNKDEEA